MLRRIFIEVILLVAFSLVAFLQTMPHVLCKFTLLNSTEWIISKCENYYCKSLFLYLGSTLRQRQLPTNLSLLKPLLISMPNKEIFPVQPIDDEYLMLVLFFDDAIYLKDIRSTTLRYYHTKLQPKSVLDLRYICRCSHEHLL